MTDQELRRLKRGDLIEILYYLQKENDELREENEKLKSRIDAWLAGKPAGETADKGAVPVKTGKAGKKRR